MSRFTFKSLVSRSLRVIDRIGAPEPVHAHCDIPCGIYDPHLAQIGALTVIRMNQLIDALPAQPDAASRHSFVRYTLVKEEHAELVKREVRVIYGDYFKPEHADKYPELQGLVWKLLKGAGKGRQEINMEAAQQLLADLHRFAEIFWETKGVATKKQPSNQAVGGEIVVPA